MLQPIQRGISLRIGGPDLPDIGAASVDIPEHITDETAIGGGFGPDFRVDPQVGVGDIVSQGAALLTDRRDPRITVTAPVAGRVARLDLGPGRRLEQVVLFHDPDGGRRVFDTTGAGTVEGLRDLLLASGLWTAIQTRPGGRLADPDIAPSAIFIAAADTRPGAVSPMVGLSADDLTTGIAALRRMGPVYVIHDGMAAQSDVTMIRAGAIHPGGLAGWHIHAQHPASATRRVWVMDAPDVAALGALIRSGHLPQTRVVAVTGPGLSQARLLRTQAGADLRALVQGAMTPGPKRILSGSVLDGVETRHLRHGDRQVTVTLRDTAPTRGHWFRAALSRASRPVPVIPSAAVDQALPATVPAVPFLRALGSGNDEAAIALGALSLSEPDLALVDYVTGARPRFADLLRGVLDRTGAEQGF
ncbi:Na(+)-translocating NADH-quinone reductase subunit A [Paracoccus sp. (in: a-proteobacteria)]|uniref:Na(+)-translocating NADH-quinone reductase subunit A n=1 Tax=Paracoccus sp. TaxID=267 RepID=UPI0026DEBA31|nr:Na(+)-translocating NADH-quinone reductase subunit A [Paracoccus sp. (in: a-proteobacteria)]MDO5647090.1 Na(+)-translocating NADH-quinone reductase subunit A [Paracoccus sp. (in: a-proteobacteria)]